MRPGANAELAHEAPKEAPCARCTVLLVLQRVQIPKSLFKAQLHWVQQSRARTPPVRPNAAFVAFSSEVTESTQTQHRTRRPTLLSRPIPRPWRCAGGHARSSVQWRCRPDSCPHNLGLPWRDPGTMGCLGSGRYSGTRATRNSKCCTCDLESSSRTRERCRSEITSALYLYGRTMASLERNRGSHCISCGNAWKGCGRERSTPGHPQDARRSANCGSSG